MSEALTADQMLQNTLNTVAHLQAELTKAQQLAIRQACEIRKLQRELNKHHPDYGTPNWCSTCSPKGFSSCRCEIACNE